MNSSKVYRHILSDLNNMDVKTLASQKGYYDLLERIGVSMLRKGEKSIYPMFFSEDSDLTGCTDGDTIRINTWSPMSLGVLNFKKYLESGAHDTWAKQLPTICNEVQMMYLVNIGLLVHEFGHVLYTNFHQLNKLRRELCDGNFKECVEKEKLEKIYNSPFKSSLQQAIGFLVNAIEDGYIENCLALEYPETGNVCRGLQNTRNMLFFCSDSWQKQEAMIENGDALLVNIFLNGVLLKCTRGYTPKEYEKCNGLIHEIIDDALAKAQPIVDDYKKSSLHHEKDIYELMDIIAGLYPDNCDQQQEQSGDGEGDSSQNSQGNSNSGNNKNQSKEDVINNQKPPVQSENSEGQESSNKSSNSTGGMMTNIDNLDEHINRTARRDPTRHSNETQEEMQKNAEKAMGNASKNFTEDNFLKKIAQSLTEQDSSEKQTSELQKMYDSESVHGYFKREHYDSAEVVSSDNLKGDKNTYDEIYKNIQKTSKACSKKVKQLLSCKEFDDEDDGYAFGTKIVSRDVYRKDKKCFSKELIPDSVPDVAFTIMVDESGSMYGEKIRKAREAAILFDDICTEVKIPTRIVGHTTGHYGRTKVINYRNFKSNGSEKISLSNISAQSGNVDTLVLTGLCEEMLKRPEDKKVVIVISDGAPCGFGDSNDNFKGVPYKRLNCYCQDEDMQQLNACVRYYRKKGIKIIGVCLDDSEAIKAIYEDGTLDCTNLSKLPNELVKIFKKYVLR